MLSPAVNVTVSPIATFFSALPLTSPVPVFAAVIFQPCSTREATAYN